MKSDQGLIHLIIIPGNNQAYTNEVVRKIGELTSDLGENGEKYMKSNRRKRSRREWLGK